MEDFELEFLEQTPVEYRCYCSRERVAATLITIGRKDLQELADGSEPIRIECQFCDEVYTFTPEQIRELLDTLEKT